MKFLLDTNAIVRLLRADPDVTRRAHQNGFAQLCVSALVLHELWFGAQNSAKPELNLRTLGEMRLPVVPFDADDARHSAEIRVALKRVGTPIGPYDLLIAAQARMRGLTLITNNVREFSRVPGLRVEDWQN